MSMAIVPFAPAGGFRIGPEKHAYNYQEYPGVTVNDRPVYRCAKGRDDNTDLLYLHWRQDERSWHAVSVANLAPTAEDILAGAPAFRAQQDDDVRVPGTHQWSCYNDSENKWWSPSPFVTTAL
jgi:hypothetical protein